MFDLSNANEVAKSAKNICHIRGEYMVEKVRNAIVRAVLAGRGDTIVKLTEPSGVIQAYESKIVDMLDCAGYKSGLFGCNKLYIAWGEQEQINFTNYFEFLWRDENARQNRKREER